MRKPEAMVGGESTRMVDEVRQRDPRADARQSNAPASATGA